MSPVYDLCVIGAGPAGFAAAMRAHDLGRKVALVEAGRLGGAGVHAGALSSKTLWHLSNDYRRVQRADRGYGASGVELSYRSVIAEVHAATAERTELFAEQLRALASPSSSGAQITHYRGHARFIGPHALELRGPHGELSEIRAQNFVIATGSTPRVPDGIHIDGRHVITSDHIEDLPDFPESMVIVGAGVVGCEYAAMLANFGRTKLFMIDRQPRILPFEDDDVAGAIDTSFARSGVTIHRKAQLKELVAEGGGVRYVIENADGERETHHVECALIAVGRVPNTRSLSLEAAGVRSDAHGAILADITHTSAAHIHAAGDVTADVALANIAELEGRYAAETFFGHPARAISYDALSFIMFLQPEVAGVGLNEQQAKKRKIPYRVGVVSNRLVARNVAMRATDGFVKLLAREDGRLLGLRVVGPQAASTSQGVSFLIHLGATLDDIDACVHPHPAVPEGVQEAARLLLGRSVHKLQVFDGRLLRVGRG